MRLCIPLALASLAVVKAETLSISRHEHDDCMQACFEALTLVSYGDMNSTMSLYYAMADSTYFMTSMYICMSTKCESGEKAAYGWSVLTSWGMEYGPDAVVPAYDTLADKVIPNPPPSVNTLAEAGLVFNSTIALTDEAYAAGYATIDTWNLEMFLHHMFGAALIMLFAAMVILGTGMRSFDWLRNRLSSDGMSYRSEQEAHSGSWTWLHTMYRKHLATPALFGGRHSVPAAGFFSIPTRLQGAFIFVYIALNVIFSCVGYKTFETNLYWPADIPSQVWRYVADRTGVMTFWNLPLLWLLAGRNDFVLWLTGWSYSSMSLFHKWVARIATLQAIVHSIAYSWIERDVLRIEWNTELYWRTGIFATVIMALMLPLSILPLRQRVYEVFLVLHILCAAALLALLYYHVSVMEGAYNGFLWACVALWAFDRAARLIRLNVLSWNVLKTTNATARITGAELGLIRLSVDTSVTIHPNAGEYFFLYTPVSLRPWENHPFTLASWEQLGKSTRLHFLIAVQSGATKRLRQKLSHGPSDMKVVLEGPYGHSQPIGAYEHCLLIAGGSGITAILPYLSLIKDSSINRSTAIVWSVKNNAYASDVLAHELAGCGMEVQLHVTADGLTNVATVSHHTMSLPADGADANPDSCADEEKSQKSNLKATVHPGRPDIKQLVQSRVPRVAGRERLAVLACGPPRMMDEVRAAVADVYGMGEDQVSGATVDYFEESFGW